ncbi:hypothetical protein GGR54DRAFT_639803 [Hypoxylon sp. NC1633]|nr:hypothetical protein GGR54DRAFT_639803 [Hypoxylon sp. NC1633]
MSEPKMKKYDLIDRANKSPTPGGRLTFIGLRALDLPWQHALLTGLGTTLLQNRGITATAVPLTLHTGLPSIDALAHPTSLLLFLMAAGSAAKQVYWSQYLSSESFPAGAALWVSIYNTTMNSLSTFLFLALSTTSLRSTPTLPLGAARLPLSTVVGALMYVGGMAIETVAERQRRVFKDDPANAGKVCKVGLWGWARHINYLGYSLWRGGYMMVGGGWPAGLIMTAFELVDLSQRAVGVLDEYCAGRYKEQWAQFKREVPYKVIPGIY